VQNSQEQFLAVAEHIRHRQEAILLEWQRVVRRDPELTQGDSLPRSELFDHIPALLSAFEEGLRQAARAAPAATDAEVSAAAHGLQRWQQGYDLREVTRELSQLSKCVILELDRFAKAHPSISLDTMVQAREVWMNLCSTSIEESVNQYFTLRQHEAEGQVKDLESALEQVQQLEQQRADQWQQAAHDLRGNLGVVANVAVGLTRHGGQDSSREDFVRILMRNVTSLHQLLDDVTSLARLQAGRETRHIEPLDVTSILQPLCEGIEPLARQRGLALRGEGPVGLAAEGDAVKIRRIAQNLILNAVKYTREGGITVTWGDSASNDPQRWLLTVEDTGPGFHTDSGQPIATVLDPAASNTLAQMPPILGRTAERQGSSSADQHAGIRSLTAAGEGIGLSIVKRLCEMLDAKIEMRSAQGVGTLVRVLFPRQYVG
jgi:signal transduction histidine kinase